MSILFGHLAGVGSLLYIYVREPNHENDDVIYCNGKSWLKSSRELDAHFTFIAFKKDEPL